MAHQSKLRSHSRLVIRHVEHMTEFVCQQRKMIVCPQLRTMFTGISSARTRGRGTAHHTNCSQHYKVIVIPSDANADPYILKNQQYLRSLTFLLPNPLVTEGKQECTGQDAFKETHWGERWPWNTNLKHLVEAPITALFKISWGIWKGVLSNLHVCCHQRGLRAQKQHCIIRASCSETVVRSIHHCPSCLTTNCSVH